MTTFPFDQLQGIDGPQAQRPVQSLLVAADVVNDDNGDWHKGVKWSPEQIGGGEVVGIDCGHGTGTLNPATNPDWNMATPFVVDAEDHCSTLGGRTRDFEGRARRQLDAIQSFEIAREFQLGALRTANALPNVALKDAVKIHPGAVDTVNAIALLESALGEGFKGRRGMIHVTPQVLTLLDNGGMLTRSAQKWVTAQGSIVASDAGYTHEDDGFVYAYATGPVVVHLGAVHLNPGSFDEAESNGLIDWQTNKVSLHAWRDAIVLVDGVKTIPTPPYTPGAGSADAMWKVQLDVHAWALHS